jgi:hypothetical protein
MQLEFVEDPGGECELRDSRTVDCTFLSPAVSLACAIAVVTSFTRVTSGQCEISIPGSWR